MNATNSELRARARETLGKKIFSSQWGMAVLVSLVLSIFLGVPSVSYDKTFDLGSFEVTQSFSLSLGQFIFRGAVMFGLCKTFLTAVRTKEKISFELAFDGFNDFKRTFLLGLLENIFIILWTLLFIIPGIVKSLAYSMAYYIMLDNPEYTWRECLDESQKMMKGHKWQLFCLYLSFIGWYIVGALALGIGVLWVEPYQRAAQAEFYNELKGETAPADNEEPEEVVLVESTEEPTIE